MQAIWFKEADASPTNGWPAYAQTLRAEFETVMNVLRSKFPNARVCFVASRIYAGYATSLLNPEPYSYEQGFACKWLIEDQINGDAGLNFVPARGPVVSPWIDWGTYNWADGLTPRSDGLTWDCADFQADGTHPSNLGRDKVAHILLDFVHSEPTAGWYLARPAPAPYGTGKLTSILTRPVAAWSGSPSLTTNDFHVRIKNALPNGIGIVFSGPNPGAMPFINATRYVGSPLVRLGLQSFDGIGRVELGRAGQPDDGRPHDLLPGLRARRATVRRNRRGIVERLARHLLALKCTDRVSCAHVGASREPTTIGSSFFGRCCSFPKLDRAAVGRLEGRVCRVWAGGTRLTRTAGPPGAIHDRCALSPVRASSPGSVSSGSIHAAWSVNRRRGSPERARETAARENVRARIV